MQFFELISNMTFILSNIFISLIKVHVKFSAKISFFHQSSHYVNQTAGLNLNSQNSQHSFLFYQSDFQSGVGKKNQLALDLMGQNLALG